MGVGFVDFLDSMAGVVKGDKWQKREYDFDDSDKEVLLDFDTIKGGVDERDDGSDQEGFAPEEDQDFDYG